MFESGVFDVNQFANFKREAIMLSPLLSEFFEDLDYFYFSKCPESILKVASDKAITISNHGYLYYGQVNRNKKPFG